MVQVLMIPYRSFKERVRLVKALVSEGYYVEVEDGYLYCIRHVEGSVF